MQTKFLALFALSALLFASCSSDDEVIDNSPKALQFTSGIVPQASNLRAASSTWAANDAIGVYMLKTTTSDIAESAENKKYVTSGNGVFAATGTDAIYYPVDATQKVDFVAYYPHSTITNFLYPINVATQSSQAAIDLLYADKVVGKDKASTNVALNFKHQLVKLELNVIAGAGITNLSGLTVTINNVNTQAEFDLKTGTLGTSSAPANIVPTIVAGKYEAILLPVAALSANNTIEFVLNGNTYVWTMTSNDIAMKSLTAGTKYSFDITIQRTGISGVVGIISDWTVVSGTGTAS